MRRILTTAYLLLILIATAHANRVDSLLRVLDRELASTVYTKRKQARIDSLRQLASTDVAPEQRYRHLIDVANEYSNFRIDSAMYFFREAFQVAEGMGDDDKVKDVKIKYAWNYMQDGDLIHPMQYMDQIDISHSPDWLKSNYYSTKVRIYNVLANTLRSRETQQAYNRHLAAFRDSAYAYHPGDWLMLADIMAGHGDLKNSIDTVRHHMQDPASRSVDGIAYYFLARIYGQMGRTERQKECLIRSSIADARSGVREYKALTQLAVMLYNEGDTRRAYQYISRSMIDANACRSKLRMMQISDDMPVITASYVSQEDRTKQLYQWVSWGTLAVAVVLLVLLWFLMRERRRFHRAHRELDLTNQKLKEANEQMFDLNAELRRLNESLTDENKETVEANNRLTTENRNRSENVMRFVNLCNTYLGKMEAYRKFLNKVAAKRNFDELYQAIKSTRYINEELAAFYEQFDEAFLRIYPDFVGQVNALLQPSEQLKVKDPKTLPTELRIYALLRLGISDSTSVCDFLRCSNSTLYNYRTKMRNRALSRDTFEDDVMQIS